jgi:hypothetical protein
MAFTPKDWRDYPNTTTPVSAAALEDLETRVAAYSDRTVRTIGPGEEVELLPDDHGNIIEIDCTGTNSPANEVQSVNFPIGRNERQFIYRKFVYGGYITLTLPWLDETTGPINQGQGGVTEPSYVVHAAHRQLYIDALDALDGLSYPDDFEVYGYPQDLEDSPYRFSSNGHLIEFKGDYGNMDLPPMIVNDENAITPGLVTLHVGATPGTYPTQDGSTPTTGGTFTLSFDGEETNPIDFDADMGVLAASVETELLALPNIEVGELLVTDGGSNNVRIEFDFTKGLTDQPLITINTASLVPAGGADVTVLTAGQGEGDPRPFLVLPEGPELPVGYEVEIFPFRQPGQTSMPLGIQIDAGVYLYDVGLGYLELDSFASSTQGVTIILRKRGTNEWLTVGHSPVND